MNTLFCRLQKSLYLGLIVICTLILTCCITRRNTDLNSYSIADSDGAVPLVNQGRHEFNFIGYSGRHQDFSSFQELSRVEEQNSVWFTYTAPQDGEFLISVICEKDPIQFILFQTKIGKNIGLEVKTGKAEIKRWLNEPKVNQIELRDTIAPNTQLPVLMRSGEQIMFVVMTNARKKSLVRMEIELKSSTNEMLLGTGKNVQTVIDKRVSENESCVHIRVRDIESLLPIVSFLEIDGLRGANGNYKASDLFVVQKHSGTMELRCFAQGYFYVSRNEVVEHGRINEVNIWLERISRGKLMVIEDIRFVPGSGDFDPLSGPKLRRLKDFMVLNPKIKIEIQGHVLEVGETTGAGQVLSETRARKVMQYLIDSGIDRDRLKAVGFGGTKPIFAKPDNAYQEQVNRRVEVLIL